MRTGLLWLLAIRFFSSAALALEFTPEESAFLREHPVWRMAGASSPPFQWIDEKGQFQGIGSDYRAMIESRLGIRLEPMPAASWTESLEQMRRGECDVSLLTAQTPEREVFLAFTEPLLVLPPVVMTRLDNKSVHSLADLKGRRAAVARNYPIHESLQRDHPEIVLVPRDDVGSAISAVALGDVDAYVGELASATDAIDRLGVRNLKVVAVSPYVFPFRIGVRKDWPEAVSALNKVIADLSPEEQAAVHRKWIAVSGGGLSWKRIVLFTAPALVGAVILTLIAANRRLAREIVRRKKADSALRESEERWSFAVEGSRDGVWDWNVKTNEVFLSRQWKAMLGYAESDFPSRFEEWEKRVHRDDIEPVMAVIQRHLRGETPAYEAEYRVQRKDGTYCWIMARGRIVSRDADGAPLRMVGTQTDISDRKSFEEERSRRQEDLEETVKARTAELDAQRKTLASVLDATPESVLLLDNGGRVLTCNAVAAQRFRKEVRDVIGLHCSALFPKEDLQYRQLLMACAMEIGEMVVDEDERDGRHFWNCYNPIINARGEATGLAMLAVDVTQLKRAEQRTLSAERRLREMTDKLPGAVYQFARSSEGVYSFLYCSEGMEAMLGVSSEDAVRDAQSVFSVMHPDDFALLLQKAEHSRTTLTPYVQDLRIRHPDGRGWWIRAESVPQPQMDGSVVWNGNIMNITERKRLEEELALAKSAAEAASQAKSAFLANMSHEIRTPMNAILGFSQLMMRDPALAPAQRQHLETINRSGEHLLALINDILEMSKIEAGRVALTPSGFDLHALLDDLERMFRLRTSANHIDFAIERIGEVPRFVNADEGKLRQVFINLIGNAVKFTERGRVVVRVITESGAGNSLRLYGEVEDSGPGLAPEELSKLFRQFEQTATGHRAGVGTGLGLAISREFVRLMGGDIRVESQPGRGAVFRFDVAIELSEASETKPEANGRRVSRLRPGHPPVRVLIADDKLENRELLREVLESAAFETRSADNGEEALTAFADWHPRVVLMDLRMPGIPGLEAMRRIRQLPGGSNAALIAVSASVFEDDRRDVFAAGGDDFLGKPFRQEALFDKIRRFTGVEYLYEDESGPVPEEASRVDITPKEVAAALSTDERERLRVAAVNADFDGMLAVLAEREEQSPAVVAELRGRIERFEYQSVLALIDDESAAG